MYILALNCGSATLKYQVFDAETRTILRKGLVQHIGEDGSDIENHEQALEIALREVEAAGIDLGQISAVGHRVVHGGDKFASSVLVDDEVLRTIEELSVLAPLHNPANLVGIMAAQRILPGVKHIAVFDTAFHQTMPDFAYRYAVPAAWYREMGVRRYGFHGTSHLYVSRRAAVNLGKPAAECNIISVHIGSGASACAVKGGRSVDTSMGMTPSEGLVMNTRAGDLDISIPFYVKDRLGLSDAAIAGELNKRSGVFGITDGRWVDQRDVVRQYDTDDGCRLAVDMFTYRIKKYIGSYMAALGRVDAIVFTAGIGENQPVLRSKICEGIMGVKLDVAANDSAVVFALGVGETLISAPDSDIKVFMIPTNEELVLVEDTIAILENKYESDHLKMNYSFGKK